MATYFHGNNNTSEIQSSSGEGLQTLYLMNPNYVSYSDAAQHPTPNMLFLNPNTTTTTTSATTTPPHHPNALHLASLPHAPPQHSPNHHPHHSHHHHQQHLIGVAIPTSNILGSNNSDEISVFHDFTTAAGASRGSYNLWGSITNQTPFSSAAAAVTIAANPTNNCGFAATLSPAAVTANTGLHRFNHHPQQGLSLTLSSRQPSYRSFSDELGAQVHAISPASRSGGDEGIVMGNGISSMQSVVLGSKYLKAAQELLDEVVNVGKGIIFKGETTLEGVGNKEKMKGNNVFGESTSEIGGDGGGENSMGIKQGGELSAAQRQELQMKKSKLVSMLDEVDQRYRQYHHQMQSVISSFEQVAGYGAAKSYTALALKTISKQFRCLKDAITSQIRATSKTLGEDDCLGAKVVGSGLRYVDHHLRQQRALQQLGMIQHNAWRPQRGLPERAVSILRAWLFEHFLHPYPKDSDKVMLAKQTGLTRSQVSNWFINARVRLWKPMVEEMYLEEVKEQEHNNNGSHDNTNNRSKELSNNELPQESSAIRFDPINVLQSKAETTFNIPNSSSNEISNSNSMSASPIGGSSSFHLAGSSELHHSSGSMEMKPSETNINRETTNTKFGNIERHNNIGGFGSFSMEDIGRFNNVTHEQLAPRFHGNGVSLTLGLPPSENLSLSGTTQHGFLSQNMHLGGRIEMGANENEFCAMNTPPSSHSGNGGYESIDIQNRKRFASQLLRDFVA